MVIQRAILLAVLGVKAVALLHLAPAEEVLHGSREPAVAIEVDVKQQVGVAIALYVKRHVVIYLVHRQPHIERLHLLSVLQYADIGVVLTLLDRQQQILILHHHALQGVALA